ncbi:MAG: efflux RND transporter periplasmic adaptor subunit [bacterium]|nr:efflux RND transporter periplasmic adaptor subunit [bacterium]
MKKKNIFILLSVVIVVVATGFSHGLFSGTSQETNSWQTAKVTRRDMGSSVLATGIIKPCTGAEVRVGSRVSGIVKKLYVKIGDRVEKGQLLGELDPTEYRARYNLAAAALEKAKSELEYATLDMERRRALKKKNYTSQDKVDVAEKTREVAESALNQAKANLDYAAVQLQYTRISAPISGVVASVSTQEGETVAASFTAPTFVVILDLNRLEVRAYVDETDIGRINEGQQATFTVDTYRDVDFHGKVTAIYPMAEIKDNVVNYVTIIDIAPLKNSSHTLRPEMTTTVKIVQESRQNVLTLPKRTIKREGGKKYVHVLKNNQPAKRWITIGWSDGKYIEITAGLNEGDNVITNS